MANSNTLRDRWRNRRRMAWGAFAAQIALMLIIISFPALWPSVWTPAMVEAITPIVTMFFFAQSTIIGVYIGFSTVDDKWKKATKNEGGQ